MMGKPKIRFKGYNEDWEQRKVSDMFKVARGYVLPATDTSQEMTDEIPYPVYSSQTKDNGLMGYYSDYLYEDAITWTTDGANAGTVNFRAGKFYCTNVCGVLLSDKIETNKVIAEALNNVAKRYVSYVGNPKLMNNVMADIQIAVPTSQKERDRISSYFSYLDHLITLHQHKCDEMKRLKKYMLQKMFPQNGKKVPEIRFDGFTNDWEQRKVLDLLIQPITDGPHETPKLVEEGVPFISVDAIVDNKIDFSRKRGNISEEYDELCCKKYKPQFHDVYLVKSGSTVGKVAIVETTDRFNIWSPLAAMRCGEKTYPYFLYDLLQTKDLQAQVADKASNGTQPNLSMRELEKFPVSVPSNLEEQKKIGDYFRNLDHLITLHQHKCDELQNLKKYMLQNMFV